MKKKYLLIFLTIFWQTNIYSRHCFCNSSSIDKTISSCPSQTPMPIASLSKLILSLYLIDTWGPKYTFETKFIVKDKKLWIEGSNDPYFLEDGLFHLIAQLNLQKIAQLDEVFFDSKFKFNFSSDTTNIKNNLVSYLNTSTWNDEIKKQFKTMPTKYSFWPSKIDQIKMSVAKVNLSEAPSTAGGITFIYQSSPLINYIKIMNSYSNNISSDFLFEVVGGEKEIIKYLNRKFHWNSSYTFHTGSGLPSSKDSKRVDNLFSCEKIIDVLYETKSILSKNNYNLPDFLSTPQIDVGTLKKRFDEKSPFVKTMWAKTGTLDNASALAGFLTTNQGEIVFASMTNKTPSEKAKKAEDAYMKDFIKKKNISLKPLVYEAFEFKPLLNAISIQK